MKLLLKSIWFIVDFNEVILQHAVYKYSDLHEIYLVFLSQFNTLASEVKCLRVIERRDTFKSKTIFYHKKTRLKPERATRPIPKRRRPLRDSYKADPEKKASVRESYKVDPEKKKASVRDSYKADPE